MRTSISIPSETHHRARVAAASKGQSIGSFTAEAIEAHLDRRGIAAEVRRIIGTAASSAPSSTTTNGKNNGR